MKIVHFSDPHFGSWPSHRSAFFDKRIVGALNYHLARKAHFNYRLFDLAIQQILKIEPQYVIISGDVSSIGDPKEFKEALDRLEPLIEHPSIKLLYVPGNHDVYVRNRSYRQYVADFFYRINGFRLDELPKTISELNLTIVLTNQAVATVPFMSNGVLDKESVEELAKVKANNEIRIGVGHFPISDVSAQPLSLRRRLVGASSLRTLLNTSLDLYLCGHIHCPFINSYLTGREICAGSLTSTAHINVLEINQVDSTIEQHWQIVHDNQSEINKIIQPNLRYSTI